MPASLVNFFPGFFDSIRRKKTDIFSFFSTWNVAWGRPVFLLVAFGGMRSRTCFGFSASVSSEGRERGKFYFT